MNTAKGRAQGVEIKHSSEHIMWPINEFPRVVERLNDLPTTIFIPIKTCVFLVTLGIGTTAVLFFTSVSGSLKLEVN